MAAKKTERRVLIGQNAEGWWALDTKQVPGLEDINDLKPMITGVPERDKLAEFLGLLNYKPANIIEGILNLPPFKES